MIPFATTPHLLLRPVQHSDKDSFLTLINDPGVALGINGGYRVPLSVAGWPALLAGLAGQLVALVLEIRPELLHTRGADPEEVADEHGTAAQERERKQFVGFVLVSQQESKKRDTEFSVALAFAWWGQELGTEVLRWLMGYSFELLGMHRLSLHALGDNEWAIELYTYL